MTETGDRLDLNKADVDELSQLPGIGPVLAKRIVAYRQDVHPFAEVIELAAVPGISEKMVETLRERVSVAESEEEAADAEALEPEIPVLLPPEAGVSALFEADVAEAVEPAASMTDQAQIEVMDAEVPPAEATEVPPTAELSAGMESDTADATILETPAPERMEPALSGAGQVPETAATLPPGQMELRGSVSRRRGCLFIILGGLLGTVLGAALALSILALLNGGMLAFDQTDQRLSRELDSVQADQETMVRQLESLENDLEAISTQAGDLALQQADSEQSLADFQASVEAGTEETQAQLDALEETAVDLNDRIDNVADAAETFDSFLNGLRDLLISVQGLPTMTPTATATTEPTETMTPVSGTATGTPQATSLPTRTPRPTATPLITATSTPAQQP